MSSPSTPHVVVVGAGIVGASLAYHLTKKGAKVTVVAPDVGGVATPNSFAWLNASWGNPRFYFDLRRRSMAAWKQLASELPDLPVQWCGSLTWDLPPDRLEAYLRQHASWGYDLRGVERSAIQAREPALEAGCIPDWALEAAEEGAVEPVAAARLMIADAEARGASVLTAAVTGFIRRDDRIAGVVTAAGPLEADHVVLAAGTGSVPLCASVGITLPVGSRPGLLVHSRPTERRLRGLVMATKLHVRQTADGRVIAGSGFAGGDPGADPAATARELFDRVKGILRESDALEMEFFTVGHRPTPEDGLPILGPSGLRGLTLAVMHSGVTLAPIVGSLLADQIVAGKSDPALSDFALSRFGAESTRDDTEKSEQTASWGAPTVTSSTS
ncbi:glycine/D-amino acid oxidase, deaminating [Xylariaceae sp. FL0662B]|nr:glycine/D-amino acid oxidase, deaminating [Xylariaceae sp. FL0662B]